MEPAQHLRAFFRRRPAEGGERALGGGNRAPRIFLVSQRYAADDLPVGWTNDVRDFLAMGLNKRAINLVRRDCHRGFLPDSFHHTSP